jgi:hypothetical protein
MRYPGCPRILCTNLWISTQKSHERLASRGLQQFACQLSAGKRRWLASQPLKLMPSRSIVAFSAVKVSRANLVYCAVFM